MTEKGDRSIENKKVDREKEKEKDRDPGEACKGLGKVMKVPP